MAAGRPVGAANFTSTVRGLAFLVGETFHRVCNVAMGTPENVNGDPILCNLSNKLCCSFYNETTLRIFQASPDHTWQLTLQINSLPKLGVPMDFFPVGIHKTKPIVAFVCWLNPGDDIPPKIPMDAPTFFNLDHGLLIDTVTSTVEIIHCFRPLR